MLSQHGGHHLQSSQVMSNHYPTGQTAETRAQNDLMALLLRGGMPENRWVDDLRINQSINQSIKTHPTSCIIELSYRLRWLWSFLGAYVLFLYIVIDPTKLNFPIRAEL
jgi:hypothetical protein